MVCVARRLFDRDTLIWKEDKETRRQGGQGEPARCGGSLRCSDWRGQGGQGGQEDKEDKGDKGDKGDKEDKEDKKTRGTRRTRGTRGFLAFLLS
ncbi:MAG: hypothetical protein KME31_22905 [Tolypothrix carrinoi HA7290-LM1]|nr:hypothetical protein [Tolypothrix carrinoi HA7290-LM1]